MSSPYRSLSVARRAEIVTQAMKLHKELRQVYAQRLVARGGGFRAVTLLSWPADRLAKEVVRLNAESAQDELDLLHLLYVEMEPAIQMAFLDTAGVKHDQGKIPDDTEPPYAGEAAVAKAAKAIFAHYGEDGRHYLVTISTYNPAAWPGLDTVLASL